MASRAAKDATPSPSERQINLLRKRKYDAMHRGGDPDEKQHPKGKLTARERIELLVDPGSFTELVRHGGEKDRWGRRRHRLRHG